MEIDKLKINQTMRKDATMAAIQHIFKKRADAYYKSLRVAVESYVKSVKCNSDAITAYAELSPEFKRLVRMDNTIRLTELPEDPENSNDYIMTEISCSMDYLILGSEKYYPFCKQVYSKNYMQKVELAFSYPLIKSSFEFPTGKVPAVIQKQLDIRKKLMDEVVVFANDTYHALCHVKSIKEVRTYIPALEQFVPIPEKAFTQMVPNSFFDKVNKSIKA